MGKSERPKPAAPDEEKTRRGSVGTIPIPPLKRMTVQMTTLTGLPPSVPRPSSKSVVPAAGEVPTEKGVELVIVEETQLAGGERKLWRAAEVWTKRRVYGLDSTFKCVEIVDRETGKPEPSHDMLGARLGGGRRRDKDKVRFSYPLPLPGMEAMFMKAKKHGYTSPVERMIVRVRVLVMSADEAAPSWEEIASRWSDPPPR